MISVFEQQQAPGCTGTDQEAVEIGSASGVFERSLDLQNAQIDDPVLPMLYLARPPKEPKIMALYPKVESTGSTGSII